MRSFIASFLLISTSVVVFGRASYGQTPLIECSAPVRVTRQTRAGVAAMWQVVLTNRYSAPVTAYGLEFSFAGRPGGGKYDDSIPGHAGVHPPLPPGGSAAILLPGKNPAPPTVTITGVIYADGATAGSPAVIEHFVRTRAIFLAELPQTIERLSAISADPGADPVSVVAHFQEQQRQAQTIMRGQEPIARLHVPPRIAGSIVATLERPGINLQSAARALVQTLSKWKVQLEQSLPKPPAIAFPKVQ